MRVFTLRRRAVLPVLCSVVALAGCPDAADRAARDRIFSAEDPSPDLLRAAQKLDVAQAGADAAVWARLLQMDRLEATRRLGAHEASTTVSFEWTRDGRKVDLVETYAFRTDAEGSFQATITNDQDAGLEFVWADGRAFARSRYGPFRERRIDRAQHDVWRDRATGALHEIFDLYEGRLRPSPLGAAERHGRRALRFGLTLGDRWGDPPAPLNAPPRLFPKVLDASGQLVTGPDEDTAHRLAFADRKIPRSAGGEVLIDEATGVVLEARFEGAFSVADQPTGDAPTQEAQLALSMKFELTPAREVIIKPPDKVVSTAIPHALQNPLEFLGDAAPRPAQAEPADEDE